MRRTAARKSDATTGVVTVIPASVGQTGLIDEDVVIVL